MRYAPPLRDMMTAIDTIKISKEDELLAYLAGLPEVAEIRTIMEKKKVSDWFLES